MRFSRQRYQAKPLVDHPNLQARLDKVQKEELNARSKEFVDSLADYYKKKGGLTENQLRYFEKIESRFSPQEKKKFDGWKLIYQKNHIKDARIIAHYYLKAGYYAQTAANIINDESFVPTHKQFDKMCGNKYAQKVLENYKAPPKFKKNQMVQIRSTAGSCTIDSHLLNLKNRLCFVLNTDVPIAHAVNGGKRYSILPLGEGNTIEADERYLMKPNKKGKNL